MKVSIKRKAYRNCTKWVFQTNKDPVSFCVGKMWMQSVNSFRSNSLLESFAYKS